MDTIQLQIIFVHFMAGKFKFKVLKVDVRAVALPFFGKDSRFTGFRGLDFELPSPIPLTRNPFI